MVEPAYSDERAEAFRAYMCLYGYKAAIDRCDWVAARRWFSEKEGERSRATARWALHCVAFATAYMVLHISMPQLVEEVPRPLRNVMDSVALTSVFAGALALVRFKEDDYYTLMVSDGDGGYGKRRYKVDEVKLIFDSTEEDARVEEVDVVRNYDVTRSPFFAFDMKGECREVEHQTRIHVPEGSWGEYQFNVN